MALRESPHPEEAAERPSRRTQSRLSEAADQALRRPRAILFDWDNTLVDNWVVIAEAMNVCSGDYPPDVDEFALSTLTPVMSEVVKPPRVKESRINMECSLMQIIDFSEKPNGGSLVLGKIVRMHVDDAIIDADYKIDPDKLHAIGRMGGPEYARTRDRFSMLRPETKSRT